MSRLILVLSLAVSACSTTPQRACPPIPNPSARTDAAPVPAQAVAATVADNYGACRETAEQLRGLQAWLIQQQAASK